MFLDSFSAEDVPAAARAEDVRIARWSARLTTLPVALGLVVVAAGLAAVLTLGLGALFVDVPAGPIAALGAALASCVVALPLALGLLKVARDSDAAEARRRHSLVEGAASREAFVSLIGREWARERRYGGGAALALLGVDRWRRPASPQEAAAAATVQRELLKCAVGTLRGTDAVAGFGEGRLAMFLAHADPTGALDAAERIRDRIEQLAIDAGGSVVRVTASVGVATLQPGHDTVGSWLSDVEHALGAARQAGGNCVRAAPLDLSRAPAPGPSIGDNRTARPGG